MQKGPSSEDGESLSKFLILWQLKNNEVKREFVLTVSMKITVLWDV
jgi:hypothetical protein